ncbi:MAG TPA: sigma-70 family RNA polymerase sigma factor [Jatrophihabitans sp.]|jgi:RNA polymerase sigma-70 factor (sigma-E family)|uniref:sigma-70 family RNA polymerase sigma factor n=1 Tax=Jatrophihabitans sp. TaxID=1932789 RepID=UPI002DFDB207|nr:sigma-70 family RNA polymerase sigma factor [Jatrophihabitans sp.]
MTDAMSFADFVAEHSRSLFGTAYLLTGNRDDAEELLQDTLARLFPKWAATVARADAPVAYVRRSLANRFVSGTRSPAHRTHVMWELPDAVADVDVAGAVTSRRLLWQLLGEVSERQRTALVLRYFHDQSDDDIAQALGCREVTVRSLTSRGVTAMRQRAMCAEREGER